jgi:hypothetical protein
VKSRTRKVKNPDGHQHAGIGIRIIDPGDEVGKGDGDERFRERLGGILRYYSI